MSHPWDIQPDGYRLPYGMTRGAYQRASWAASGHWWDAMVYSRRRRKTISQEDAASMRAATVKAIADAGVRDRWTASDAEEARKACIQGRHSKEFTRAMLDVRAELTAARDAAYLLERERIRGEQLQIELDAGFQC